MKPIVLVAILTPLWLAAPATAENITCTGQRPATTYCENYKKYPENPATLVQG